MSVKHFCLLLLFSFYPMVCLAQEYVLEDVQILLRPGEEVLHERIEVKLENRSDTYLDGIVFQLVGDASNIRAWDTLGGLKHEKNVTGEGTQLKILFREPLLPGEKQEIVFEFDTRFFAPQRNGSTFKLFPRYDFETSVSRFSLSVELDEETRLLPPIVPTPVKINSYSNKLFVEWNSQDVSSFTFLLRYEPGVGRGTLVIPLSPLAIVILAVSALAMVSGVFIHLRRDKIYMDTNRRKTLFKILKKDERVLIEKIMEGDGAIEQSLLYETTGFSKPKVSRLLSDLEERGLIRKEKYGRTNLVTLTELWPPYKKG